MQELINYHLYIREIQHYLTSGVSLRAAIEEISDNPISLQVKTVVFHYDRGSLALDSQSKVPVIQAFYNILFIGLSGNSILEGMSRVEVSIYEQIEQEFQKKLQTLPVRMMLPLLFLMFPAYLILMLGPILSNMMESIL